MLWIAIAEDDGTGDATPRHWPAHRLTVADIRDLPALNIQRTNTLPLRAVTKI